MGIDVWVERKPESLISSLDRAQTHIEKQARPETEPINIVAGNTVNADRANSVDSWSQLRVSVSSCQACTLHETRTQTVFGVGNQNADWVFVCEAPGADEDVQGEPFVGRAGKLLNAMLLALGLSREQVFIANVLKCRPPNNRDPRPEEVVACEHFLQSQIRMIEPKIIVALGRHAAHSLLKSDQPLSKLRGRIHSYENTPLMVTYHPAYLLRSPAEKAKAWMDLCAARKEVSA